MIPVSSSRQGYLSILRLVVARVDGLPGGLAGGVDEVKGGILTEFDIVDVKCA